ncbi:MAG: leucine--tRNA ligase [Pseudomonadota bacterium]
MESRYQPADIEPQVQNYWRDNRCFEVTEDPDKEKFYCLCMFPYPSGALHMGHVRNYTIGDVIARYQRMQGKNVLQPIGWDAFGLPAENAAMKNKVPPANWTRQNIEHMRGQFERLGMGYDWSREFATCDPSYYRWEQWFFTRLMKKGLVYKKNAVVNWDPVDQTVLANEQVIDGRGWRSGALVERREIPQWFMKITAYVEELLTGLDTLDGWPDSVRTMQRNWIGRSVGLELAFPIENSNEELVVYTTRPDTLFGVTYMAVAAEHPLAREAAQGNPELQAFLDECRQVSSSEAALETMEKKGMPIGVNARHPITGDAIPVMAANFVLMDYGTGAIMAVPGHDERDWEFATKYTLPIRQVIEPEDDGEHDISRGAIVARGRLVNSGDFSGMQFDEAFDAIADWFESRGKGKRRVNYRLRDWGVSRQRYWGAPIPVINAADGETLPVPEGDLPVVLPEDVNFDGSGSPIKSMPEFIETKDPRDGAPATRETDTFDTFFESSWYYARFACPDADDAMLDERARYWLPVDQYVGGIEHAILHLLYARFFHRLMRDEGLVDGDEPMTNLLTQGMVNAQTYFRQQTGADGEEAGVSWYNASELELKRNERGQVTGAVLTEDGQPVEIGGVEKMSKSKRNGVDPQEMIDRYGADTVRLFAMSDVSPDQGLEWTDEGIEGSFRFHKKLWRAVHAHVERGAPPALAVDALNDGQLTLRRKLHATIAKATDDIGRRKTFNTAIAAVRELMNDIAAFKDTSPEGHAVLQEAWTAIIAMLSPVVPHMAHVLWEALGCEGAVIDAPWPVVDESALVSASELYVVQVNGKLRAKLSVPAGIGRDELEATAMADENVQRFTDGKQVRKVIVVPGKLVNIVVG